MANAQGVSRYFSCFVSYGQPDLEFAKRLVADLEANGVLCWCYNKDATPGARTQKEIGQKRREAEKVIALCSVRSLIQEGVLSEIDDQIREDPDKLIPVSLDDVWQHRGFRVIWSTRDLKPLLQERNYADFSDESAYQTSLAKLLAALERSSSVDQQPAQTTLLGVDDAGKPGGPTCAIPAADGKVLERRVAGIARLLKRRAEAKDLSFAPQILDELASVLILKYDLLPSGELDEPQIYLKLIRFLNTSPEPLKALLLRDLRHQGRKIDSLQSFFEDCSRTINTKDRSPHAVDLVQDRLSRLYTLVEAIVTDETDEKAAEAKVQIALAPQENDTIEYKSTLRYNLVTKQIDKQMEFEVIKAISGLANHEGGTLYIGVGDRGEILGTEPDLSTFKGPNREDLFRRHFDQLVDKSFGKANYQMVEVEWAEPEGKKLFVAKIKKGRTPTFVRMDDDGDFYVRRGARTLKLGPQRFLEYYKARWPAEPPAAS